MSEAPARVIPHLVAASDRATLRGASDVRIVDVRWRLGDKAAGRAAYAAGHIPGAVFADIEEDLAAPAGSGERGRHPLPSPEAFARVMERLGIGNVTRVIAYDDQGGATAARLWFLLRYFGHETGAVLDGGIQAFTTAGGALETSVPAPTPSSRFHPHVRPDLLLEHAAVVASLGDPATLLLDARASERYRGDQEPIDARPGHIPSAKNAPYAKNLEGGKLLSRAELERRYRELGAFDPSVSTAVYCGSGVTACHDLLALAVAGHTTAKLYPGSWSEWSRDPLAPVALGD